ncbi:hypothetical protein [Herbiconiux liangxiaofengii]|uniref:hypothetical protein n=1 Tax=Herbiconiux liangxiaofengii TaxID=3342795 RepID=UPI0035BAE699
MVTETDSEVEPAAGSAAPVPEPSPTAAVEPVAAPAPVDLGLLIGDLDQAIATNRRLAKWLLIAGAVASIVVLVALALLTQEAVKVLSSPEAEGNYMLGAYEILRGAAYAGLAGSILFGLFTLGRAALDQATRYEKRKMAAHFMQSVTRRFDKQIGDGTIKFEEIVAIIDAWSSIVESAFTKVKFGSREPQPWAVDVTKEGASFRSGASEGATKKSSGS